VSDGTKKILVHVCCAHCLAEVLSGLEEVRAKTLSPVVRWFNPNIHPLIEWRRRLKAVKMLCERAKLPLLADERYGLRDFLHALAGTYDVGARCRRCYALRLGDAARTAAAEGIPLFTTTLITSVHQDHAAIRAAGEAAAAEHGVTFLYRDLRAAKDVDAKLVFSLYKQQYCGCVFSEEERFAPTVTHLYPPRPGHPRPDGDA